MVILVALLFARAATSAHLSRPPSNILRGKARTGDENFRVLYEKLVRSQVVTARLPPGVDKGVERGRYWNVGTLQKSGTVWMLGKAIARHGLSLTLFLNCTASLQDCLSSSSGRSFRVGQYSDVTENFGVFTSDDGTIVGIGGENGEKKNYTLAETQRREKHGLPEETGAYIVRAPSFESLVRYGWSERLRAFGNDHGCFERYFSLCKLDSKFSVSTLGDLVHVYIRANLNETGGGRAVQVIQVPLVDWMFSSNSLRWSSFKLVEFARGGGRRRRDNLKLLNETCGDKHVDMLADYNSYRSLKENDVYLFNVKPNPVRPSSLLATFPVVLDFECAFIAIAASSDGIHFSSPLPIIATETYMRSGRTFDHPVDGFRVEGETVSLYVQANVQGIVSKDLDTWPPNIVRYDLDAQELGDYTDDALLETTSDVNDH